MITFLEYVLVVPINSINKEIGIQTFGHLLVYTQHCLCCMIQVHKYNAWHCRDQETLSNEYFQVQQL